MTPKARHIIKVILSIYILIGLFIGMIYGTTIETINKIGSQLVKDRVLEINKVFRNDEYLMICYSSKRKETQAIDFWINIPFDELTDSTNFIIADIGNSSTVNCEELPINVQSIETVEIEQIEQNLFNQIFDFFTPIKIDNTEKLYYVQGAELISDFGYFREEKSFEKSMSFIISPPNIEIDGDKSQILFLPFAIIIDIIAWPYRLSQFFNSSHQTM